jgi:DNA polymerase elongation subunit (family B)
VRAPACLLQLSFCVHAQGPFIVWNEPNEKALLRRWFDHMRAARPGVYVTYNGDFFDWPFIAKRSKVRAATCMRRGVGPFLEWFAPSVAQSVAQTFGSGC